MITPTKRLIAALSIVVPVVALATSPVMAATHHKTKAKAHHVLVHKVSHKTHSHKAKAPTAS